MVQKSAKAHLALIERKFGAMHELISKNQQSRRRSGQSRLWRHAPLAAVALTTLAISGMARAQTQNSSEIQLDAIEVVGAAEQASGPVDGYIARRSDTATKTDTPLIETPQSVTVVTRDQIADQGAQSVGQALRYTANVLPETR